MIIAVKRLGCGDVTETAIAVLPFVLTGLLLRAKTVPRLWDWLGKVTATRLLVLVIVPDKVHFTVAVADHGDVWVIVSVNGSFEIAMLP